MEQNWKLKGKYLIVLTLSIIITYVLFRFGLFLFLPFFFAYWLAKLLLPVADFLKKKLHFSPAIASAFATLLSLTVLFILVFWLGSSLLNQAANFLSNFHIIIEQLQIGVNRICSCCDSYFNLTRGTTERLALISMEKIQGTIKDSCIPKLTAGSFHFGKRIINFGLAFFLIFFSAFYLLKDWNKLYGLYENSIFFREIQLLKEKIMNTGTAWLKTQFIIFMLIALILSAGLLFLKNPYALLLGIIIALLDALPFIGSGLILIPWAVLDIIGNHYKDAAVLAVLFILCQLLRELLEPKLMGSHMGIPPLYSLAAVFLGIKLFGIWGVILGPMSFILIQTIMKEYQLFISKPPSREL